MKVNIIRTKGDLSHPLFSPIWVSECNEEITLFEKFYFFNDLTIIIPRPQRVTSKEIIKPKTGIKLNKDKIIVMNATIKIFLIFLFLLLKYPDSDIINIGLAIKSINMNNTPISRLSKAPTRVSNSSKDNGNNSIININPKPIDEKKLEIFILYKSLMNLCENLLITKYNKIT